MKIKYDTSGVDHSNTPQPAIPGGVYNGVVEKIEVSTKKPDGTAAPAIMVITTRVTDEPYEKKRITERIQMENPNVKWKLDQFLQSVGIDTSEKEKGTFDTKEVEGTYIRMRVIEEAYVDSDGNDAVGNRIKVFFRNLEQAGSNGDGGEVDLSEAGGEPEDAEGEDVDGEQPEYTADELLELAEAADGEDEQSVSDLEEFFSFTEYEVNDYPTWTELVELYNNENGEGGDDEESGGESEEKDYDSMSLADLREEPKSRSLATNGPKSALIKRLQDNDKEPF